METNKTIRNRITRIKIGETLVELMDKFSLEEISVSMIARKAKISRMTFYHYYETKEDVLTDYLSEIIMSYVEEVKRSGQEVTLRTFNHLKFALEYFSNFDKFMLTMEKRGNYYILINGVNKFLKENFLHDFKGSVYNLYFYSGALLNVFLEWLKSGKKESAGEIANIIISYQ